MKLKRHIVAFDAADIAAESAFWAQILGGTVDADDDWHTISVDGRPQLAVQLAPNHVRPEWPDGTPQQIHLDLYPEDMRAAHDEVLAAGGTLLQSADLDTASGFQVYADPAGHPFCLCWGSG
jgi:predicted enzyme related to lactoylglutathione lyase